MKLTFAPKGLLQIDDARIIFRNFRGEAGKFNREGDRSFSVIIPEQRLTIQEMENIEALYNEARIEKTASGPVLLIDGTEVLTYADALQAIGWNVKIKPPREEGDDPFIHLPIKVKFNDRGPLVYMKSGNAKVMLDKGSVHRLDNIDILSVNMHVRPYNYDVNGSQGISAYLQAIEVIQQVDRFADRHSDDIE